MVAPAWTAALIPETAAIVMCRNRVTWYSVLVSATSMAAMFHNPVRISTANAGQAMRLNRRATARGASGAIARSPGTRPASVS